MSRTRRIILTWEGCPNRKDGRDRKKWYKPPKWYKRMKWKRRKAKEKDAIIKEREIPIFKKDDVWDWC